MSSKPTEAQVTLMDDILCKTPLMSALSRRELKDLLKKAQVLQVSAGDFMFRQSTKTDAALYVVLQGQAFLHKEGTGRVTFDPGRRFGEDLLAAAQGRPINKPVKAPYSAAAKTDLHLAKLTLTLLRETYDVDKAQKCPDVEQWERRRMSMPSNTNTTSSSSSTSSNSQTVQALVSPAKRTRQSVQLSKTAMSSLFTSSSPKGKGKTQPKVLGASSAWPTKKIQSSQTVDALCVSPVKRKSNANAQATTSFPKAPSLVMAQQQQQQQRQQAPPKASPIKSNSTRGRSSNNALGSTSSSHHGRSKSVSSKRTNKSSNDDKQLDYSSSSHHCAKSGAKSRSDDKQLDYSSSSHHRAKSAAKSRSDDKQLDYSSSSNHRAKSAAKSRSDDKQLDSSSSNHRNRAKSEAKSRFEDKLDSSHCRAKSAAKSRSSNDNDYLKRGSTHDNNTRRPKSVAKSRSADDLEGLRGSSTHGSGHRNNSQRPKSVAKSRSADDLQELRGLATESARGRSASRNNNNSSDHKRSKSKTRVADDLLSRRIEATKKNAQSKRSGNEKGSGSSHDKPKDTKSSSTKRSFTPSPKKESPRQSSLLSSPKQKLPLRGVDISADGKNESPSKLLSKTKENPNRRSSTPMKRYIGKDEQTELGVNHSNGNIKKTSARDSPSNGCEHKIPKSKINAQKVPSNVDGVSPRAMENTTPTTSSKLAYANKSKSGPVHHNTPPPILGHDGATTQQQARSLGDDSYESPPQSPNGRKQKSNKNLEPYQSPQQSPTGRQPKSNKNLESASPQTPKHAEPVTPGRSVKERFLMAVTTPKRDLRPVTPRRSLRDSAILGQTLSLFENENAGKQPEAPLACPRTPGRLSPQKVKTTFDNESPSADAPKTP